MQTKTTRTYDSFKPDRAYRERSSAHTKEQAGEYV